MLLATEHIVSREATQKKLLQACIALMSLKFAAIASIVLSCVLIVLFILYLLFDAIYQVAAQIGQLWVECNAIEKLLFLLIAWAFIAWACKRVKVLRDAAI